MNDGPSTFRIGKTFRFDATRRLDDGRYDGHSFTAEAVLSSRMLSPEGFVVDFGDLAPLKRHIDEALDHRILNDRVKDVSDEGVAEHLLEWASDHLPSGVVAVLEEVRVRTGRPRPLPPAAFTAFEASHQLRGLREGHPCGRLHGHSYVLTMPVPGSPDGRFADIPVALRDFLGSALHGSVLNEAIPGVNPTSEHLARYASQWLADRPLLGDDGSGVCVRVSETETSWAEFTR
ncbi:6-pyruvoyl tetrahydropterin synthase family protein [Streptomyces globisporus]|uniref:6-pyruvoyl trahydropterin synthase family protein n=1 Tax=Streptomyces globisporus TaxID=1908 RepID=UPI0036DC47E2